jgi:hypothetical protein
VYILEPGDPPRGDPARIEAKLPSTASQVGKIPNIDEWLPGDILLFASSEATKPRSAIVKGQERNGYRPVDAQWYHAALWLGDFRVIEATLPRVRVADVDPSLYAARVRVRHDPVMTERQRLGVLAKGARDIGRWYGFGAIAKLTGWRRFGRAPAPVPDKLFVCSQLCANAYASVTQKIYGRDLRFSVTPADLSQSPHLQDRPVFWRPLP